MNRLQQLWLALRTSLWFVPGLIVLLAMLLAVGLIKLDTWVQWDLARDWPLLFGAGSDGARSMLATIAGSMITVAGVTFSITIVALSLTSSQYSPRILRNFVSDRANQIVLGVFVGVFTYCLVVLRTIRGGEDEFVPPLAVFGGFLLSLVSIGVLIFFIHHIAASIQASNIIASAARQALDTVRHLFPQELGEGEPEDTDPPAELATITAWHPLPAHKNGYIQAVAIDDLLSLAAEREWVIRMDKGIGEFAVAGLPLVAVAGARLPDEDDCRALNAVYTINRIRTVEQDAAFGIRQIVDVALKALSPGINDTTTAVICLDYLSSILAQLATQRIATPYRYTDDQLRVIAKGPSFAELVADSLNQIRQNADGNVTVLIRMLKVLETVAALTVSQSRRQVLREHTELIAALAERSIPTAYDRAKVQRHSERCRRVLDTDNQV